jgi:hypothetical protein
MLYNNDITSCGKGIRAVTSGSAVFIDFNNYHSNTTDIENASKGDNATANDPSYTDAGGADFSNTLDAADAMPMKPGTATQNVVQGAWQPSGGAAGTIHTGYIA